MWKYYSYEFICIQNQFMIKENNERYSEAKKAKFLDRFQGRTSTIGKAGLLSLLQQNIPQRTKINNQGLSKYLESDLIQPRQKNPEISGRFKYNQANEEDKRSSNHSFKTDLPRRNSVQSTQMGSMAITNSSSIPKLPKIGKPGLGFNIRSSMQLKAQRKNSQTSNKDTAQHLQFLNLFQQRLKKMNRK